MARPSRNRNVDNAFVNAVGAEVIAIGEVVDLLESSIAPPSIRDVLIRRDQSAVVDAIKRLAMIQRALSAELDRYEPDRERECPFLCVNA